MKNKFKNAVISTLIVILWIGVWHLAALLLNNSLFLPSPQDTATALWELLGTPKFYKVVSLTLLRVLSGLLLGVLFGILFAAVCHKFFAIKRVFSPIISVIRSTPVATFIVLLWIMMDGSTLAIVVAFLMVMPIVWQNTLDGFASIPKELVEVAQVYELPFRRKYMVLILPVLSRYIFPAVITSVGLAWKSEIAAEIIAYTKNSIGMHINDAKSFLLTPTVFAWTIIVIVMSLLLEWTMKKILGRFRQ